MALSIDLKPGERIIIGEALITNTGARAKFSIQGDVPILREKDILKPDEADTPCKQLYLAVQLMYITRDSAELRATYFDLTREILEAAPSMRPCLLAINDKIIGGSYFQALKEARKLIQQEARLLACA
ncbi:MAG: flagellar biosynthesis repressor FlbT [Defluviicoccus sp.]|nr:flagellar biosynthesis repressor FlbT [Defluviicoccus sp.]MDG4592320.1 flagellar biosynthesis repressor FlbT [Defluviicoccus sp.]MDS4011164.1 flagellar biosynthesis repressor FlbT [Defluviicoccus sp.]MDS4072179.1 flagellar biosynthesis repressor FlbT [Defluviicoccus sp.]